jgi:DinB superfamily
MNPYASFLGSRDAVETVAHTPERIASLIATIGEKRASEPPAPGKWCAREIVAHLADCELVFAFRLRQTLAEENPAIQPFDQEKWAASYAAYGLASGLETFSALRRWNLALIRSLAPEAMQRKMTHPERGTMTFQTVVETMGGHDLNHLGQLERIASASAAGLK